MQAGYRYDRQRGLFVYSPAHSTALPFLAVNWNIVGHCINACTYCYGKDIRQCRLPSDEQIAHITSKLVALKPSLVILTGGEPLLCPTLPTVIDRITHASIPCIVDTSAVPDMQAILQGGIADRIHLRISLDGSTPAVNEATRISHVPNSTDRVKTHIAQALGRGIPVTVQTTVTEANLLHLPLLGDYLCRAGVEHWRLSVVIPHTGSLLQATRQMVERLRTEFPTLQIRLSNAGMDGGRHIILLDPAGVLWARGSESNEKQCLGSLIDGDVTRQDIIDQIDIDRHMGRYLAQKE